MYNPPVQSGRQQCTDCAKPLTNSKYSRCSSCHRKYAQERNDNNIHSYRNALNRCPARNFGRRNTFQRRNSSSSSAAHSRRVSVQEIENDLLRNQAKIIDADKIYEVSNQNNYDPKRYRMIAKVTNATKGPQIKGLIDTGCNIECISLRACQRLGLHHLIVPTNSHVKEVEGEQIDVCGELHTTLY